MKKDTEPGKTKQAKGVSYSEIGTVRQVSEAGIQ